MGQNFSHLWNGLPEDERHRLHPFLVEAQILHLEHARAVMVRNHKRAMSEFDQWIKNLKSMLPDPPKPPAQ